jgi:hypothetical protein
VSTIIGETPLVAEQVGVIDWLALEGSGAAAADRQQLGSGGLGPLAAADPLKAPVFMLA